MDYAKARRAARRRHDYLRPYVGDLGNVIDHGGDPRRGHPHGRRSARRRRRALLGAHRRAYRLDLTVVNDEVDPTFRFMTLDWDGKIRMDPSSPYAMQRLIALKDEYDIAFACDTDHDRHGIVTASGGLMPPNHYLSVAVDYLFRQPAAWKPDAAVGKTVVSSAMIDRVGRPARPPPVRGAGGFQMVRRRAWSSGDLGFGGEESAGASFLRRDGSAWSTDKDGIMPALLAAEITARAGRDPGEAYRGLTRELGEPFSDRVEARATPEQKKKLAKLDRSQIRISELAGDPIEAVLTHAPGNQAPIGGVKVVSKNGWFAARPSGTEDIYKIYAESFRDERHLAHASRRGPDASWTPPWPDGRCQPRSPKEPETTAAAKRLLPWLVAVGFFMESLDTTILNTAVPAIAHSLNVAAARHEGRARELHPEPRGIHSHQRLDGQPLRHAPRIRIRDRRLHPGLVPVRHLAPTSTSWWRAASCRAAAAR